ncbi:hypothetical protein BFS35_011090 [Macrococcoides goetzii]|uniref:Uncharacterized protein n=1 Tax=Macrococcoides goetzii TaxID=1891097 RepID=A0A2G5NW64_9STAP|nr:hypothetical protein [Macrococcus goetzii]RAI79683.1 hypothetical protein BFS35_011090 [Macrococcus goetzii]
MAVKTIEVEEYICDVCGGYADGSWFEVTHLNGEVYAEMSCPIDLCQEHMGIFARWFTSYAYERGCGQTTSNDELIKKMKKKVEEIKSDVF